MREGAKIHVGTEVGYTDVRTATGRITEACGLAKNQSIVLNTGGVFDGGNPHAPTLEVKISVEGANQLSMLLSGDGKG